LSRGAFWASAMNTPDTKAQHENSAELGPLVRGQLEILMLDNSEHRARLLASHNSFAIHQPYTKMMPSNATIARQQLFAAWGGACDPAPIDLKQSIGIGYAKCGSRIGTGEAHEREATNVHAAGFPSFRNSGDGGRNAGHGANDDGGRAGRQPNA